MKNQMPGWATSVLTQNFVRLFVTFFAVIPADAGIQSVLNSWISGRASLPAMTFELYRGFLGHHTWTSEAYRPFAFQILAKPSGLTVTSLPGWVNIIFATVGEISLPNKQKRFPL
jgi:hypothetical protein